MSEEKEIIINGIDVSECKLYDYGICDSEQVENLNCEQNPDCYFKQHKRLKQQIEAYQLSENEAKEIIAELKHKNKRLQKENEELKEEILKWQTAYSRQYQINENKGYNKKEEQYRQTLQEIKEISEPVKKDICNNCGWKDSDGCEPEGCACNEFITILHKIDEVINEK